MVGRPLKGATVVACLMALALGGPAAAQISPGKLSRAHAALEGSGQCLKCHDSKRGVAGDKCLVCHQALRVRIAAGHGLHARPDHRDCKTCHVEHQGLEYELVWWGKSGRQAFDHGLTGYALAGRHAQISCEQCHQARYQKDRETLSRQGANLSRTYLGLAPACDACHRDEHRGQFAPRPCADCHGQKSWKPAAGFDHSKTAFPLTGRHTSVACDRCHKAAAGDSAGSYRRYKGVSLSRECSGCHADPHQGRLGTSCASCHDTTAWRRATRRDGFDHDRTRYPLRGRHADVACQKCHPPGKPLRVAHERCSDCHADGHAGQFAKRADQGRCESCHEVTGFVPARFSVEDHQKTAFPLAGGHLAVACNACHAQVAVETLRGVRRDRAATTARFRFAAQKCADCHRDPHLGEVDRWTAQGGCEICHRVESWRESAFDHSKTRYPLAGGHAKVACTGCHKKVEVGTKRERIRFAGLAQTCASCHQDPHRGQLARGGATACDRCHTVENLRASRFDHNRDAVWALKGAHMKVPCSACHKSETRGGATFVRYKPLPTACKGCHGRERKYEDEREQAPWP